MGSKKFNMTLYQHMLSGTSVATHKNPIIQPEYTPPNPFADAMSQPVEVTAADDIGAKRRVPVRNQSVYHRENQARSMWQLALEKENA